MEKEYTEIKKKSIPAVIESIQLAEQLVEDVCNEHEGLEDHYGNMLVAITEAVNNAIKHGSKNHSEDSVTILVRRSGKDLCFVVKDQGDGFDFENLPDPTAPDNIEKEHGRGVFLMKSLADSVAFKENGAEVHLLFSVFE
jgi:serine/threonine-protein kinase RsbW